MLDCDDVLLRVKCVCLKVSVRKTMCAGLGRWADGHLVKHMVAVRFAAACELTVNLVATKSARSATTPILRRQECRET